MDFSTILARLCEFLGISLADVSELRAAGRQFAALAEEAGSLDEALAQLRADLQRGLLAADALASPADGLASQSRGSAAEFRRVCQELSQLCLQAAGELQYQRITVLGGLFLETPWGRLGFAGTIALQTALALGLDVAAQLASAGELNWEKTELTLIGSLTGAFAGALVAYPLQRKLSPWLVHSEYGRRVTANSIVGFSAAGAAALTSGLATGFPASPEGSLFGAGFGALVVAAFAGIRKPQVVSAAPAMSTLESSGAGRFELAEQRTHSPSFQEPAQVMNSAGKNDGSGGRSGEAGASGRAAGGGSGESGSSRAGGGGSDSGHVSRGKPSTSHDGPFQFADDVPKYQKLTQNDLHRIAQERYWEQPTYFPGPDDSKNGGTHNNTNPWKIKPEELNPPNKHPVDQQYKLPRIQQEQHLTPGLNISKEIVQRWADLKRIADEQGTAFPILYGIRKHNLIADDQLLTMFAKLEQGFEAPLADMPTVKNRSATIEEKNPEFPQRAMLAFLEGDLTLPALTRIAKRLSEAGKMAEAHVLTNLEPAHQRKVAVEILKKNELDIQKISAWVSKNHADLEMDAELHKPALTNSRLPLNHWRRLTEHLSEAHQNDLRSAIENRPAGVSLHDYTDSLELAHKDDNVLIEQRLKKIQDYLETFASNKQKLAALTYSTDPDLEVQRTRLHQAYAELDRWIECESGTTQKFHLNRYRLSPTDQLLAQRLISNPSLQPAPVAAEMNQERNYIVDRLNRLRKQFRDYPDAKFEEEKYVLCLRYNLTVGDAEQLRRSLLTAKGTDA